MTTQPPTLTDPNSARGRLLTVAARLFRDQGYQRTTVRDLAREIGIQSGSLFHHFRSKEDILLAVMEETIRLNTYRMRAALNAASGTRGKLLALIESELQSVLGETGAAMTVLVYEWRSLSEKNRNEVLELREIYESLWLQVLEQARQEGIINTDPFILRRLLTGALSWTINWFHVDGKLSISELAQMALDTVLRGDGAGR
jgi:TetR/AcrR family transcriptional regulator, cholesterol catabolism regulator